MDAPLQAEKNGHIITILVPVAVNCGSPQLRLAADPIHFQAPTASLSSSPQLHLMGLTKLPILIVCNIRSSMPFNSQVIGDQYQEFAMPVVELITVTQHN